MVHTNVTGIPAGSPRNLLGYIDGIDKKIMARVPGTVIGADTGCTHWERTPVGG